MDKIRLQFIVRTDYFILTHKKRLAMTFRDHAPVPGKSSTRTAVLVFACLLVGASSYADSAGQDAWITRGFESFSQGTLGNAGQNLYVSRAGILQRIHRFDLNSDGFLDILICNSQEHWEKPPAYVYSNIFGDVQRIELPSDGAVSGVIADLNNDGAEDLVLAMENNGTRGDLNAFVYFGGPDGMSERYRRLLPAPRASSVTAGDFNGDGRVDLAFAISGKLRLFYQNSLGFEPKRFSDLPVKADQIEAADLDGDGFADLYVLAEKAVRRIHWGSRDGITDSGYSEVRVSFPEPGKNSRERVRGPEELADEAPALARILRLDGTFHLLAVGPEHAALIPVSGGRRFGDPLTFDCRRVVSAAVGDVNGDRKTDLVLAARAAQDSSGSWVYWGDANGFKNTKRTRLPTTSVSDVAMSDLNGDGLEDIVICQDRAPDSFTYHSLVFKGSPAGVDEKPVSLESLDARRVLIGRTKGGTERQVVFVNYHARGSTGAIDTFLYLGSSEGFSPDRVWRLPAQGPVAAVCTDFNDDGRVDSALANCSENAVLSDPGSFIYLGSEGGFPKKPTHALSTTRAHGVSCADLNRDGYLDLTFVGFNNSEILTFWGGADGFTPERTQRIEMRVDGQIYDEPRWNYLVDLNRDGWLDLVVPQIAFDRSFVLWGGPQGFSMQRRQMLAVWHGSFAQAADLDGNGWPELVIGGHEPSRNAPHDSFVHVYWNGPEGLSEDRCTQLPANAVNALGIADFNGDGNLDIFVSNYNNGRERDIDSFLYWGREGGRFSESDRKRMFAHSASGSIPGDFNEDGYVDLAVAHHKVEGDHIGFSSVWWNGPDGFSQDRQTHLPSMGPHGMIPVDPGNQLDRGPEEYYVSAPFALPASARATAISWKADIPDKTWVRAQIRYASTREALDQSPWQEPWLENGARLPAAADGQRWIQYRLALGAKGSGSTPRVSEVRVDYQQDSRAE